MREAQEVVAHADSLREAHLYAQNEYDDSLSLAQAYETLKKIPLPFREGLGLGSSYAHACYHYGRMLRAKGNYVEAMKVFIDATHSRTRDYRILGRIYNNMGSMCHLAGDYALSYDMFAISADCFLQNGDTINYYYGLNDMAYRLAEQGKKEETLVLLDSIARNCNDKNVILKTWETKAILHQSLKEYKSVIITLDTLFANGYSNLIGLMCKARAFSYLEQKDSSIYYAKKVVAHTNAPVYLIPAYYILSHDDSSLSSDSILSITSKRADAQKAWTSWKEDIACATQILQQDLTRRPDLRWLYSTIGSLVLISFGLFFYVRKKHRKRELLSQQIEELENRNNDTIAQINAQIENNIALLSQSANLKEDLCWGNYKKMCIIINQQFGLLATKLQRKYKLSEKEIRLCILVLLGVSNSKQLANFLYYSESGIRNFKSRVSKKIGTNSADLRKTLIKIVINDDSKD